MEVMRRASLSVSSQAERQMCEMRRLVVESGRGSGVVFTPVRATLVIAPAPQ